MYVCMYVHILIHTYWYMQMWSCRTGFESWPDTLPTITITITTTYIYLLLNLYPDFHDFIIVKYDKFNVKICIIINILWNKSLGLIRLNLKLNRWVYNCNCVQDILTYKKYTVLLLRGSDLKNQFTFEHMYV